MIIRKLFYRLPMLVFLSGVFISQHGLTQEDWDVAKEATRFESCYASHPPVDRVENCNYIKQCIDGPATNSTSRGMAECAVQGLELWDNQLNAEYQALIRIVSTLYGDSATTALREAQKAWIEFRDKECYATQERSNFIGFVGGVIHKSCVANLTAERAVTLATEVSHLSPRYQEYLRADSER